MKRPDNKRRGELIERDIAGTITDAERVELASLQEAMGEYLAEVAPLPMDVLERLEAIVEGRQQ